MDKLVVRGTEINVQWDLKRDDFLSLTDIAKIKDSDNPRYIIQNWLRNRNTIEFLGVWETLYNPDFNRVEFDAFRSQAGLNSFVMTPQNGWMRLVPLALSLKLDVMVEPTPIRKSHLSLPHGSPWSLSSTWSRSSNDSRPKR